MAVSACRGAFLTRQSKGEAGRGWYGNRTTWRECRDSQTKMRHQGAGSAAAGWHQRRDNERHGGAVMLTDQDVRLENKVNSEWGQVILKIRGSVVPQQSQSPAHLHSSPTRRGGTSVTRLAAAGCKPQEKNTGLDIDESWQREGHRHVHLLCRDALGTRALRGGASRKGTE
ncbi:hypothetical protein E2C01_077313 [Portunus trituberculatus]|uniref:Uncharacterized protein n=1 Tax=Portunus trituberculatus TaxID=210409 RepID=A0A5B7IPE2_PORTR|nr:hypothetical protein [Portunus trituberculatus]